MPTPLVLLPGLMCDAEVWADVVVHLRSHGALSDAAAIVVVDHGFADSLAAMADHVLATAPPVFALAGHSMGGRVALEVVRRAPQRVSHLGLFNTGALPREAGEAGARETDMRLGQLRIAIETDVAAMALQWVQGMVCPARWRDDAALVQRIVAMFARKSSAHFAAQTRALLHRPDAVPVLRTVRVPTLLLSGTEDVFTPPAQHQQMLAHLRVGIGQLVVVEHAAHMAPMEQPEAVAKAMQDWLRA